MTYFPMAMLIYNQQESSSRKEQEEEEEKKKKKKKKPEQHKINKPNGNGYTFRGRQLSQNCFATFLKNELLPRGANSFLLE